MNSAYRKRMLFGIATWVIVIAVTTHAVSAKKKPHPDPPPGPVEYEIFWVEGWEVGLSTEVNDVNDSGEFVGYAESPGDPGLWVAIAGDVTTGIEQLMPNRSEAVGINNDGLIAGDFVDDGGMRRVFVYDWRNRPADLQVMPPLPGDPDIVAEEAIAIDDDGRVIVQVRIALDPDNVIYRYYVWLATDDSVLELPGLGPSRIDITGMNNSMELIELVGFDPPSSATTMFYYSYSYSYGTDTYENIGETYRVSWRDDQVDINVNGTVAGTVLHKRSGVKAAWCANVPESDCEWMLVPSPYMSFAVGINDRGQICGGAERKRNQPLTVFIDDPDDGYWLIDELLTDDPAYANAVDLWMHFGHGSVFHDNIPTAISDTTASGESYGYIVGYKEMGTSMGGAVLDVMGFVLTPIDPDTP